MGKGCYLTVRVILFKLSERRAWELGAKRSVERLTLIESNLMLSPTEVYILSFKRAPGRCSIAYLVCSSCSWQGPQQ